jgi:hypothetical protein
MPAAALSVTPGNGRGLASLLARHLDFALLALALPVFIAAGWPLAGYVVATVVWTGQAVLIAWLEAKAGASSNPRTVVGLLVGGSIARAWIAAIAILTAGLAFGDPSGLSCALLLIVAFTVYFASKLFVHFFTPAQAQAR